MFWVDKEELVLKTCFIKFIILRKLSKEMGYQIIEIQVLKRNSF